jgi:hypothetical protein
LTSLCDWLFRFSSGTGLRTYSSFLFSCRQLERWRNRTASSPLATNKNENYFVIASIINDSHKFIRNK